MGILEQNLGKTTEVMLCGFCKDKDMYKVDSMYDQIDSLEGKLQNVDLSHCHIWKMIRHD